MSEPKKVFIVQGTAEYQKMFEKQGWQVVDKMIEADLVQFTGGADVSPDLYDEYPHKLTINNAERDAREVLVFSMASHLNIPMAGICRGGQFLNVMRGGKLYQHVDGHARHSGHDAMDTRTREVFHVTSTHHQMMRPGREGTVIAVAKESMKREWMSSPAKISLSMSQHNIWDDVEVVFYPGEPAVFCFQPHPEFTTAPNLATRYFKYLDELIFGKAD